MAETEKPDARWYALHVRSRHEQVVDAALSGKGYVVFCPVYKVKRKRVDRTVEIKLPLFPGYVFSQFDVTRRLPILTTPGVVSVVRARSPEPVDDREIASLQTVVTSGIQCSPWPFLRAGQRIQVRAGPLSGAEGIFVRVKNEYRLVCTISLLQRAVAVEIEQEFVRPI